MKHNVVQINGGITINVDVSVKYAIKVIMIMFGILVHVFISFSAAYIRNTILTLFIFKQISNMIRIAIKWSF